MTWEWTRQCIALMLRTDTRHTPMEWLLRPSSQIVASKMTPGRPVDNGKSTTMSDVADLDSTRLLTLPTPR